MWDIDKELIYTFWSVVILTSTICLATSLIWCLGLGRGRRLLPLQRDRHGSWQGREVFLAFLIVLLIPVMVQDLLTSIGFFQSVYGKIPSPVRQQLWSTLLALPVTVAGITFVLYFLSGTRPADLGLTRARLPHNVVLGAWCWLPLTVLTLGIYQLVSFWIRPEDHPLAGLRGEGTMLVEWLLVVFEAVVAAPILEELLFRGVLMGWLRRCSLVGHYVVAGGAAFAGFLPVLAFLGQTPDKPRELELGPPIFVMILAPLYLLAVHRVRANWQSRPKNLSFVPEAAKRPGSEDALMAGDPARAIARGSEIVGQPVPIIAFSDRDRLLQALLAVFGSSLLWASFHATVWPTPIPLFFLGLGLGWLAYRSQSLVSSMVVHALFNGVACLVLGMTVWFGNK